MKNVILFSFDDFINTPVPASSFAITAPVYAYNEGSFIVYLKKFYEQCELLQQLGGLDSPFPYIDLVAIRPELPPYGESNNAIKRWFRSARREAKKRFLKRTGKKVARGFKKSNEYKRILNLKNGAIELNKRWSEKRKQAKRKFLQITGKKIARGFKKSKEYLSWKKRLDRAVKEKFVRELKNIERRVSRMAGNKKLSAAERKALEVELGLSSITYPIERVPFYVALSYSNDKMRLVQKLIANTDGLFFILQLSPDQFN